MQTQQGSIKVIVLVFILTVSLGVFAWMFSRQLGKGGTKAETSQMVVESSLSAPAANRETSKVTKEFVKAGKEYDSITANIQVIGGKLVYSAQNDGRLFIVNDDQELGKQYDSASSVLKVGDKFVYKAIQNRKSFLVYDGVELGKEYYYADYPTEVNGKLAYSAQNPVPGGVEYFMVYDGKEIGEENGSFDIDLKQANLLSIDGKLIYTAYTFPTETRDPKRFIVYDGVQLGRQYDTVTSPQEINGKLAYVASKDKKYFIVYDGVEIGKEYDKAGDPVELNGKLAYFAQKNGRWFIVHDGQKVGQEFDEDKVFFVSNTAKEIDGRLAYEAAEVGTGPEGENKIFIMYDGVNLNKDDDFQKRYVHSTWFTSVNDKIVYKVGRNRKEAFVYNGAELGRGYDQVENLVAIGDKLAYEAIEDTKSLIVYDGEEVGKEYDHVSTPTDVNGKLAFLAIKNGKYFMVMEK